jgi:hypothetical protein
VSGHLIGCVKRLKGLPNGHKLGLVAFADSADDRTHIGFPGYEGVQEWADVGRSQAANIIADLVEWGFLRQHKRGHRGQRAEYVVFPSGCCDQHRTPVEEPPVDVEALATAAGVTLEAARLMLTALGTPLPAKESTQTGPNHGGKGPLRPDPNAENPSTDGDEPVDNLGKGPERVRESRSSGDAFTTSTNPPTPASGGAEAATSCPRHPTGHPNCRGCGTTARQRAAAAAKTKAAENRRLEAERVAADRRAREDAARPPTDLLDAVRAQIDHTRTHRKAP